MTRTEQLKFCKICKEKKFDLSKGIICGLTNLPADFERSCDNFKEDAALKAQNDFKEKNETPYAASKEKRLANYLLDWIFILIFALIFGFIIGIVLLFVSPASFDLVFDQDNRLTDYIFGFIVVMIYYSLFEGLTGRTLAKYITKTKVVNEKGEKPNFETILIRTLCRFIPLLPFSFLGSKNTGWHDRLSKTVVVEI